MCPTNLYSCHVTKFLNIQFVSLAGVSAIDTSSRTDNCLKAHWPIVEEICKDYKFILKHSVNIIWSGISTINKLNFKSESLQRDMRFNHFMWD